MDPNKLYTDLTWVDLTIIGDIMKAIKEVYIKMFKHRDLKTVCSQLKIENNAMNEASMQRIIAINTTNEKVAGS